MINPTIFKSVLEHFNNPCVMSEYGSLTISFVDLATCEEWWEGWCKGVVDGDLEALRELLYKVGVSRNAVHIERKMHRPLSQNSPVEDYIIYYTPRKDDYWIKNHASVEQMIDASEKGMREDLMRIKNDVSVGESGGGFREMTLGVDEEQL